MICAALRSLQHCNHALLPDSAYCFTSCAPMVFSIVIIGVDGFICLVQQGNMRVFLLGGCAYNANFAMMMSNLHDNER